jgi:hypothetical protein
MNKYLLLRDNKESGPYTVDELTSKGLKPYDLVWLEGKSAAWRYPSEIADLQAFAPQVEEQPYDRFYKKKPEHQQNEAVSTTPVYQPQQVVNTEAVVATIPDNGATPKTISTKKIYVTLPAVRNRSTVTQKVTTDTVTANPIAKQATTEVLPEETAVKDLSLQFEQVREEKMRQAQMMAANPAVKRTEKKVMATVNDGYQSAAFVEYDEHFQQQPETLYHAPKKRGNYSTIMMRSIVAACLLLGGVIIGLYISNSRQKATNATIEKLVQQIQDDKAIEVVTPPPPAPVAIQQQEPGLAQDPLPATTATVTNSKLPGADKNNTASLSKNTSNPPAVSEPQPVKVVHAVVTNKPEENGYNKPEVESARRNIHQMVALEANKYKTGVLGGISDLKLTVSNSSNYPLDQVEVEVRYMGPEKRVIKTQMMLFNDVAAGETKTLEAPRTNRGVTVDYSIVRINSRALGLASAGY